MAKTVLIVEDNELNMKLFHDLLEAHGYSTVGTRNGIEALDLARKHRPDLILMDIQLPGMDGLALTRRLKADPATAKITVVALTAHAMSGDREQTLAAGCAGYISKPIDTRTFGSQVREFLHSTVPTSRPARTDARLNGT
jgi:two-component system, cell cycle response regulator DivK